MDDILVKLQSGGVSGKGENIEGVVIGKLGRYYPVVERALDALSKTFFHQTYRLVPKSMKRTNEKLFDYILISLNDFVNKMEVISIRNIPDGINILLVGGPYDGFPKNSIPITLEKFLLGTYKAISIEKTRNTKTNGTYQLVLEQKDYNIATKHLKKLFSTI